jgi:hypothetical protein
MGMGFAGPGFQNALGLLCFFSRLSRLRLGPMVSVTADNSRGRASRDATGAERVVGHRPFPFPPPRGSSPASGRDGAAPAVFPIPRHSPLAIAVERVLGCVLGLGGRT